MGPRGSSCGDGAGKVFAFTSLTWEAVTEDLFCEVQQKKNWRLLAGGARVWPKGLLAAAHDGKTALRPGRGGRRPPLPGVGCWG